MDLKSLKRKELQALCKTHGVPANSTNSQMIESLSLILENPDMAKRKGCLKGSGGGSAEDLGFVGGNMKKKVTFVVEKEEDVEVEEIARKPVGNTKRESVADEVVSIERRSTRSHGLAGAVLWSPVIEKRMKKSMRGGTEGVRRNDEPISSEVLTTRSLRNAVAVAGQDEESVNDKKSKWKQKRKGIAEKRGASVIEDEKDDEFEVITRNPVGDSKGKSDVKDVEIGRRSTRSRASAETVHGSPVIPKTRKKRLRDGSEGVRGNDGPISSDVLTTRSLRNRAVVVGGEVEQANDQNSRRTWKRKISDKKEENETVASKLEEDEFVGRKNLRKRSRDGDFVSDEAPGRRSSRNHVKSEENVADPEEVDVSRSMKRRKRDTGGINEGIDENTENANRTKGMIVNANAVESRDVNNAEGQKMVQSRGKTRASKRGGRTTLTRRSTRSSTLVGKPDEEVEAANKGKLRMHEKDGAGVVLVSEPVRRSRGSPLISQEQLTSLPVAGLPVEGTNSHGSKGGEVIAEPSRRSTRSSSVVGKSDEAGQASKKGRAKKADSEVIAEPIRRSTRASSTLQEDGASLPVAKSDSVGEVVKKSKSPKQAKGLGSKGGASPTSLRDSETIAEPGRRSTESSSSFLEDGTSLPVVEAVKEVKSQKQGKGRALKGQTTAPLSDNQAVTEPEAHGSPRLLGGETFSPIVKGNTAKGTGDHTSKMDDHASAISTRRSTRGSSKLVEDGSVSKIFDLTASVPDNEPVTTPSRISARSSSKLLEDRNLLATVSNEKLGKKSKNSVSKGDRTAMVSRSPVVSESVRRSTRSSFRQTALEVETSSRVERKKTRKEKREDDLEGQRSEIRAQTKYLEEHEQSKELLRSVRSTSKKNVVDGDEVGASKSDGAILVSDPPIAGISFDLSVDARCGNAETEFSDDVDKNVHEIRRSPAKVEEGTSLVGSSDIEENVSNLFPIEPSIVETNNEPAAPSEISKELSATFDAEISMTVHTEEPDSMVKAGVERDNIITGSETMHASSSQVPNGSEELSLGAGSPTSHGIDREEPRLEAEIHAAGEDGLGYDVETDKGLEEQTLTAVTEADPEIDLREPDSKVEDDGPRENVVADDVAKNVCDPLTSDTEVCSDSHTPQGTDLEEPGLKLEISAANEGGLQGKEETEIVAQTSACEKSAEPTPTYVIVYNPEIDLKEPDLNGQVDRPSEDVTGEGEAEKTFEPMTSDTEVGSETFCDVSIMGSDSKGEVHDASKGGLEQNEPEIELEEPDSNVQVDRPSEDALGDNEAQKILDPVTSNTEVYAETLCNINVVGSDSKVENPDASKGDMELEICVANEGGANDGGLLDNEETDIVAPTSVCESSAELTQASVTVANPEIDLKEPDSYGQVDGPSEDVMGDDEAKNIFDPKTSGAEVCSEAFCDISVEGSDSKVEEVHDASKGDLEQNEATPVANPEFELEGPDSHVQVDRPSEEVMGDNTAKKIFEPMTSDTEVCAETLCDINAVGSDSKVEVRDASKGDMEQNDTTATISSVMSYKYTGILSSTSLNEASPHSDLGQVETRAENKEDSHSEGFLTEASDILCKTSDVSITVDRNPGETSSSQTVLDNETENCKANPDIILKSQLEIREHDAVNDIEAAACDKHPQTWEEDLEVLKETWVSSTVAVTVNEGTEIEDDRKDAEKNENELRSSLPMESHAVEGTQSSSEELVDAYEKELGDAEKKWRVSSDGEFSAGNNDSLMSPVAFMKSEGTPDAAPLEHKDEPSAFEVTEVSTEIVEDKYSLEHGRSTPLLDASSESDDQMEDYKLCDADVESKGYSTSSNENTTLTDVEKFVDRGDLPLPVTFTCGEETPLSGTEAPTLSGNEGLTMQVNVQGFSCIRDNEGERSLSDCQEVTLNVTENLGVDTADRSPKSEAIPGTSIIVNKLTDIEFERTTVSGAMVLEEMVNIGSLESEVNAEGYDGTKADSIEPDNVDLLDDGGQKRDSGELRTDENASRTLLNNSASESAEQRVLLTEEISPSTCMNNDLSLPKMDMVLPREEQLDEDYSAKTFEEDGTLRIEEFPSASNLFPLAGRQECQVDEEEECNKMDMVLPREEQLDEDYSEKTFEEDGTLSIEEFPSASNLFPLAGQQECQVDEEEEGNKMDMVLPREEQLDEDSSEKTFEEDGTPSIEEFPSASNLFPLAGQVDEEEEGNKMDMVLPREEQLDEDSSEKTFEEDGTPSIEEFPSASNLFPLAGQQECQVDEEEEDNNLEERAVDNNIDMSDWVLDEESNKYEGAYGEIFFSDVFDGFEQASNADEAHIDNEAAASIDENVEAGECEENFRHDRWEEYSKMDRATTLSVGEDEVKGVVSGSPVAVVAEPSPSQREKFYCTSPEDFAVLGGQEQNKQSTHDQIDDGNECAQNTSEYRRL